MRWKAFSYSPLGKLIPVDLGALFEVGRAAGENLTPFCLLKQ